MSTATVEAIPTFTFTENEMRDGTFLSRLVAAVETDGPILRYAGPAGFPEDAPVIFMVGPEANRFVLHTHRDHFSHAIGWTPLLGESAGQGLLNMDDPTHAAHRRIWSPAFTRVMMESYVPIMRRVIESRTSAWVERGEVDLLTEAREITFDIAAVALAGLDAPMEIARLREMFYALMHGLADESASEEEWIARYERIQRELVAQLVGLIDARRRRPVGERGEDVLARILDAHDESGESITDIQLIGHLNILLLAGHETTTTLGAWTLYKLAQRAPGSPEVLAQLDPEGAEAPDERWLDAFIRECGRLYPPVINVPRGVTQPFEFAGYAVPAGALLRLGLGASARLASVFEAPERFDPARFLPPREEDRATPYGLVTFGGGPRICIGINFAQIEVRELVRQVLTRFRLEPTSVEPPHCGYWTAEIPGGLPVRVSAR